MDLLIDLVGKDIFANYLTWWFTPLDGIREYFTEKLVRWSVKLGWYWTQPLISMFSCPKCIAFWGTLIYTMNFTYALINAILAQLIYYILKKTQYVE